MDEEIFKDIPGWEGYYQVSNLGRVKHLERHSITKKGKDSFKREGIMKQSKRSGPYKYAILYLHKEKKYKSISIHRMVLTVFVGPPPEPDSQGMHLDDNPENNKLTNLKWGSPLENTRQIYEKGRQNYSHLVGRFGGRHYCAKKVVQFDKSGSKIIEVFGSVTEASKEIGITDAYISKCCKGKRKFARGYVWKYYEDCFPTPLSILESTILLPSICAENNLKQSCTILDSISAGSGKFV